MSIRFPILCLLVAALPMAGEPAPAGPEKAAPAVAPVKPTGKTAPKRVGLLDQLAEEKRSWTFRPNPSRPDVFIDLEAQLTAAKQAQGQNDPGKKPIAAPTGIGVQADKPQSDDGDQLLVWAKGEEIRIRQLVAGRRYDDALRASDAVLKPLEAYAGRPDVAAVLVSVRTYRAQAEEAKIRDEAQAAFDALKIRVLGILWSQDGARLAIIDGETRSLAINDRVRDTVIVNIDQDRVDFRFHYQRRRFEFPCYVERQTGAGAAR